jgi:hypothetical protein
MYWPARLTCIYTVGVRWLALAYDGYSADCCGLDADSTALSDVGAAALHDLDESFVRQHPDSLARGQPGHAMFLHEPCFRRDRSARRVVAALDRLAQDCRYLQVQRRLAFMINRHAVKLPRQRGCQTALSDYRPVYLSSRRVAVTERGGPAARY